MKCRRKPFKSDIVIGAKVKVRDSYPSDIWAGRTGTVTEINDSAAFKELCYIIAFDDKLPESPFSTGGFPIGQLEKLS